VRKGTQLTEKNEGHVKINRRRTPCEKTPRELPQPEGKRRKSGVSPDRSAVNLSKKQILAQNPPHNWGGPVCFLGWFLNPKNQKHAITSKTSGRLRIRMDSQRELGENGPTRNWVPPLRTWGKTFSPSSAPKKRLEKKEKLEKAGQPQKCVRWRAEGAWNKALMESQ